MSTSVILLTGPVGAGKTEISRELVPLLPGAIAAIEGDTIVKEVPLDLVVVRPSAGVCAARASSRKEGRIADHAQYQDLYDMFEDAGPYVLADDEASPGELARRIAEGLSAGRFRIAPVGGTASH